MPSQDTLWQKILSTSLGFNRKQEIFLIGKKKKKYKNLTRGKKILKRGYMLEVRSGDSWANKHKLIL